LTKQQKYIAHITSNISQCDKNWTSYHMCFIEVEIVFVLWCVDSEQNNWNIAARSIILVRTKIWFILRLKKINCELKKKIKVTLNIQKKTKISRSIWLRNKTKMNFLFFINRCLPKSNEISMIFVLDVFCIIAELSFSMTDFYLKKTAERN